MKVYVFSEYSSLLFVLTVPEWKVPCGTNFPVV